MKIPDVDQIRALDRSTIELEGITSVELMERAAMACANWVMDRYTTETELVIACGEGNNGGDGLAIARLLVEKSYSISVIIITGSNKQSEDFIINYERLKKINSSLLSVLEITNPESFTALLVNKKKALLIDAILGSGLNRPTEGLNAEVIRLINQLYIPIISIDIPSGLYCDKLNEINDIIIRANYTLTFQLPKLSFMFVENAKYVGEFSILDIHLNAEMIYRTPTKNNFITKSDLIHFLKRRSKIAHKGNFGHALILAGSKGKMGAAVLSSRACMRSGVGLLTVHSPACGYEILQTTIPEAMVIVDSNNDFISETNNIEKYDSIGIGPGIGTEKQTQNVLKLIIQNSRVPIVFDADAINIIAENKTWLAFVPANSIFTPHIKEFERLTGKNENSVERLKAQRDFSIKNNVYVVLKGAHTSISCPNGDVYFNSTGNSGMATGGSGDVLTGIITSLMAQGYTSQESCMLGVYLHGLAGDFAAKEKSEEAMIASDIIEYLSEGFHFLKNY